MTDNPPTLLIYGTTWCSDCLRVRRYLDTRQIPYQWIDIDKSPDGQKLVESLNHGNRSVPTILFPDGSYLVEPSLRDLISKLKS